MDYKEYAPEEKVRQAADYVFKRFFLRGGSPKVAIMLGTGAEAILEELQGPQKISYKDIPDFPIATAPGHSSELYFGTISGVDTLVFSGRFHFYEGYTEEEIAMPVRLAHALGARILFLHGAVGGLNKAYTKGGIFIARDYVNFNRSPLVGRNYGSGPRFPDMIEPFDLELLKLVQPAHGRIPHDALEFFPRYYGTYVSVTGPQLETKAEYRFLATVGDVVGMSTVPETIVAVQCRMKVFSASIITDMCIPETLQLCNIAEILATASKSAPYLAKLVANMLEVMKLEVL